MRFNTSDISSAAKWGGGVRRTENKSVLINGAAGGLGRKTALRLAEKGARLALTDFNVAGLDETVR